MLSFSLRQRTIFTSVLMAILAVILVIFIILPTIKEIFSLEKNISDVETYFERQYEQTKLLRKSIANLEEISTKTNQYRSAVINHGTELDVITTLETLADNYKLKQDFTVNQNDTIEQVDKKSPRLAIHLPSISFSITNKGTFINQLRYLKALEQLPYYIFIDKLEWQKNKNLTGADSDTVILKFDARVYVKEKK